MKQKMNIKSSGKYLLKSSRDSIKAMRKLNETVSRILKDEELKMAKPERAILKMVGGWTVAEIERLLIGRVMAKIKGRAKWPNVES
jgi:hypothetical protein